MATPNEVKTKKPFVTSIDRKAVQDKLRTVKMGEVIEYEELSRIIGRDIQNGARHVLEGARRALLRERIGFLTLENVGLQRMTDSQLATIPGERGRKKIRRAAGRAISYAISADYEKLSATEKIKYNAALSFMGALKLATTPQKLGRIEVAVALANGRISLDRTLDAFRRKKD